MKTYESLKEIQRDIRDGATSCRQLVEFYLSNIEKYAHLNAFLEVYHDEALQRADEIDQKIREGKAGRLAGAVIGLKDVLCHQNHRLQCSSHILDGFISQFSGTAVKRLLDEDAIIIGRQNCDEFAMGSSNENSYFGPVKNGLDEERVPGGSSGGSAVAVQMDMCLASLGTDTGGSVRQPAAFCGVYGLKPTYSRISRYGLSAYASSFDTIGIFTKNVEANAAILQVMAGKDEYDSTVSHKEVPDYPSLIKTDSTFKIGIIRQTLDSEGLDEEIKEATIHAIDLLKEKGHTIVELDFDMLDYVLPTYYILTTAEASSNLSRYDGVRYGYRSEGASTLEEMYKMTRTEGFGEEVKRRIMLGTFVLSASYHDAFYTKAQKVRRLIRDKTVAFFEQVDIIALPTTPTVAFKINEKTADPLEMYLADLYTVQASVAGIPALSIPNGNNKEGMPVGLQLMANYFEEEKLYQLADQFASIENAHA